MTTETLKTIGDYTQRPFNFKETVLVLRNDFFKYLSWGVSKFSIFTDKQKECTGLILKVNGHHFKGYVLITLSWDDVYRVTLVTTHGNVKEHIENVYVDMLVKTIDDKIENIKEYVQ